MRRRAAAVILATALGGCTSFQSGPEFGGGAGPHWGKSYNPPSVPGVKGPYGESVAMTAPYDYAPPGSPIMARQMMNQSIPLSAVQVNNSGGAPAVGAPGATLPSAALQRGPILSPPGVPFAPGVTAGPSVGGGAALSRGVVPAGAVQQANMPMGSGVINANISPAMMAHGGAMQNQMMQANQANGARFQGQRTQIRFVRPSGMRIAWFTQGPGGQPMFSTTPLETPGRYNFSQAAIYRLKLSNIEQRPGLEVYPTMEVVPCNPKTEAFLAHSAVPIEFTQEDFKQVAEGNYLVKVIYLPDPQFQDAAGTGTDEILSTRLEPGADPIQEALRRGSILVVLRMGNVDQEAPNTPPLNGAGPHASAGGLPMMAQSMMAQPGLGVMPPVPQSGLKVSGPLAGRGGNVSAPAAGAPKALPMLEVSAPKTPLASPPASKTVTVPPLPPVAPPMPPRAGESGTSLAPGTFPAPAVPGGPDLFAGPNLGVVPPPPSIPVPEIPPSPGPPVAPASCLEYQG